MIEERVDSPETEIMRWGINRAEVECAYTLVDGHERNTSLFNSVPCLPYFRLLIGENAAAINYPRCRQRTTFRPTFWA
jgi:hypothetical protein